MPSADFYFSKEGLVSRDIIIYLKKRTLKLRSSRAESNWQLRATVGQNSSSVQMAYAYHVDVAVLAHVARRGQLDSALDERSFNDFWRSFSHFRPIFTRF